MQLCVSLMQFIHLFFYLSCYRNPVKLPSDALVRWNISSVSMKNGTNVKWPHSGS